MVFVMVSLNHGDGNHLDPKGCAVLKRFWCWEPYSNGMQLADSLFRVYCCTEVVESPEQSEHLLLIIHCCTSPLLYRLGPVPIIVVDTGPLSIVNVNVVYCHVDC